MRVGDPAGTCARRRELKILQRLAIAAFVGVFSAAAAAPAAMPAATFSCQLLMSDNFEGASPGDFMPSPLATFTLDGKGGYLHPDGTGKVTLDKGVYRFASGTLMGTTAVMRTDSQGRTYLHVDSSVTGPPRGLPKLADVVCYRK